MRIPGVDMSFDCASKRLGANFLDSGREFAKQGFYSVLAGGRDAEKTICGVYFSGLICQRYRADLLPEN